MGTLVPSGMVAEVAAAVSFTCCSNPVSVVVPVLVAPASPTAAGEPVTGTEVEPETAETVSVSDSVDGAAAAPIVMVQEPDAKDAARVAHVPPVIAKGDDAPPIREYVKASGELS
jgi:hypothetical protein